MSNDDKVGEKAAKKYDREAEEFAKTDKGERAAEEAKRAIDSPEGKQLRDAERRGRAPAKNAPR